MVFVLLCKVQPTYSLADLYVIDKSSADHDLLNDVDHSLESMKFPAVGDFVIPQPLWNHRHLICACHDKLSVR